MALPTISGEFLVVGNPELRFTPSGTAVCSLRLKASSRQQNPQSQQWEDKDVLWIDASVWRDAAQHTADSIADKDLVVATGTIKTREWEDQNGGGKRSKIEMTVTSIGPSMQFRTTPHGAGGQQAQGQQRPPQQQQAQPPYGGQQGQPPYGGQPQAQPPYGGQPQGQPPYQGQPQAQPQAQPQQDPSNPWGPPQGQPAQQDPWGAPGGQPGF
jgi:single-strand DNA-binding protein